jgi:hypothetical protein
VSGTFATQKRNRQGLARQGLACLPMHVTQALHECELAGVIAPGSCWKGAPAPEPLPLALGVPVAYSTLLLSPTASEATLSPHASTGAIMQQVRTARVAYAHQVLR